MAEPETSTSTSAEQPSAQESIMSRVANLPLVSSAYDMVASVYSSTKENHPYVKSVCEVAEQGVRTVAGVAATTVKPLVDKLEPQISSANQYACLGLDKLEQTLPILQQPTEQVAYNARSMVGATVNTVTSSVTGVIDKTKGTVTSGVEITKGVVSDGVSTVMNSRVGQLVTAGVDTALGKTDEYVDYYLPPSELDKAPLEQSGEAASAAPEGQLVTGQEPQSYYVQLSCLSTKVRQRLYEQSVTRLRNAKLRSQHAISQLQHTVNLIEYAKTHLDSSSQLVQEKLQSSWQQWKKTQPAEGVGEETAEQSDESRTLVMARALSQQVQASCLALASNVRGLPQNVQDQAQRLRQNGEDLVAAFRNTTSFKDLPEQLLTRSKEQMAQVSSAVDGVIEYVAGNVPGGWVVGPLRRVERPCTMQTEESGDAADLEMEAIDAPVEKSQK